MKSPLNFNIKLQISMRVCKRSYVEYVDSANNSNPLVHACNLSKKEKKKKACSRVLSPVTTNLTLDFHFKKIG
jgi:hypothetical protein